MESIFKEKYGYMKLEQSLEEFCSCNIYIIKVDSIYFFGIEDAGGGIDLDEDLLQIANHCIMKYKSKILNSFFLRWYNLYHNRGVEWVEIYWDNKIPIDYDFSLYCQYNKNPFTNFYKF